MPFADLSNNNLSKNDDRIRQLFYSDLTHGEIAQELGISKSTLRNKIKKLGLTRQRVFHVKVSDIDAVTELLKQGLRYTEIAEKLGTSVSNLRRLRKKAGIFQTDNDVVNRRKVGLIQNQKLGIIPAKIGTCKLDVYIDEIVHLLSLGLKKTDIARLYNVCPGLVYKVLRRFDLNIPTKTKMELKSQEIKNLYMQGLSGYRIAEIVNCSYGFVHHCISTQQLKRPTPVIFSTKLSKQEELIRKLFNAGVSQVEIGKRVGAHAGSICRKIKNMGLSQSSSSKLGVSANV